MDYGSKVLRRLIKDFDKMTKEEYLKLHERAMKEEIDLRIFNDHAELFFDNE